MKPENVAMNSRSTFILSRLDDACNKVSQSQYFPFIVHWWYCFYALPVPVHVPNRLHNKTQKTFCSHLSKPLTSKKDSLTTRQN